VVAEKGRERERENGRDMAEEARIRVLEEVCFDGFSGFNGDRIGEG